MNIFPVGKLPADLLRSHLADIKSGEDVVVGPGIGRDAAAVRVGDQIIVLKTDPITFPTENAGWYLVNINANDIACMGATPRWMLVTALLPENQTTSDLVESLFSGLKSACNDLGCELIGGHTEITEGLNRPILVGQMIGIADEGKLVDPRSAHPGDAVLLIGGIAVEGTSILATEAAELLEGTVDHQLLKQAKMFARVPGISVVRYAELLHLDEAVDVRAMHDPTEGGLATGIDEIAVATGLGIEINAGSVHVFDETKAITEALELDPWGLIASGALLAVVPEADVDLALQRCADLGVAANRIGQLTSDPDQRTLIEDGERWQLPSFPVDEIARFFAAQ